jgi:hypothetical protein
MNKKNKPTQDEINLATKVYYDLNDRGMLTPEQDSMLESAIDIMERAGLLDGYGNMIEQE